MIEEAVAPLLHNKVPVAVVDKVDEPQLFTTVTDGAFGATLTAIDFVALAVPQLLITVYFTVTVPAVTPVTMPPDVMVAEPVPLVTDQVPPAVASSKSGVEAPTHTVAAPLVIAATVGKPFTVRDLVATEVLQVLITVYFTVTVPAVTPVTMPPDVMVAEPVPLVTDQVPPAVASVKAGVVAPVHTVAEPPVIGAAVAFGAAMPEPAALVHPPTVVVTVYVPAAVTVIEEAVDPLLHKMVPPVGIDKVELPQLFATVTTGVAVEFGAAMPEPAALVHPPTVVVTVYVPAAVTVIEAVVAPVLHNNVPV